MDEYRFVLISKDYPYNDTTSAGRFENSVSDPTNQRMAKHFEAAAGFIVGEFPSNEIAQMVSDDMRHRMDEELHGQLKAEGSRYLDDLDPEMVDAMVNGLRMDVNTEPQEGQEGGSNDEQQEGEGTNGAPNPSPKPTPAPKQSKPPAKPGKTQPPQPSQAKE